MHPVRIETVNNGHGVFELHSERHQLPFSPHICFFYNHEAPENGGETSYCDGALLYTYLSDTIREFLQKKQLWYYQLMELEVLTRAFGVSTVEQVKEVLIEKNLSHNYEFNAQGIIQKYEVPFFGRSRFSGLQAFVSFLLFNRYTRGDRNYPTFEGQKMIPDEISDEIRSTAAEITTFHKWQKGDLLMLDNTRFMHGRNSFNPDDSRIIWTRFGYANFS